MSLLAPEDEGDGIEVAWEDQQRINTFSKLNNRLADIQDRLKIKIAEEREQESRRSPQDEKEYYDDLEMELELADGPVLYKLGEAFFQLSLPAAKKQLRADIKRYNGEIGELRAQADECVHGMDELKVLLYAKFGKQINLETGPE
ncbi:Prefoldin, subunit 4 [Cutaneotrichosporon oleaginosum]|uniref:Prefoldin subunit 4 n=1 Tax=Cutaneotrichosporon oleaginosum TaxID=879819 RepID=A0A0J0XH64_9TREE|nr:Prefoldin, subunit 4 [Cutaneotrichosporon oleaginosum]KLT40435.1 Prefoldin, subunit 4 [Cutaneotrichosporon oleaginosum]